MTDMNKKLKATLERIIRERLDGLHITKIEMRSDKDFDGDEVYYITVVFDAKKGKPDPERAAGLVRYVRSGLGNRSDHFPIFRYISEGDAKRIGIEA